MLMLTNQEQICKACQHQVLPILTEKRHAVPELQPDSMHDKVADIKANTTASCNVKFQLTFSMALG